jgi:GST-like protein
MDPCTRYRIANVFSSFEQEMDDLTIYMWATPNSRRASILLEELGLKFRVEPVNIRAKEQFTTNILALNPYCKVPIITWREGSEKHSLFESGAILIYLAETYGRFLPSSPPEKKLTLSWLMISLTSLGPHSSQAHHWSALAPKSSPSALEHCVALVERVYRVVDERLAENAFLAGEYSIADIAAYPWITCSDWTTLDINDFPNIVRWRDKIAVRPAVARAMALPEGVCLK